MTCKDVANFLDDYLEGELPRMQKWVFDAHIALCKDCRRYIAGYKKAIELSRHAMTEETAPAMPEELVQAILRAKAL